MNCLNCGLEHELDAKFCRKCGNKLETGYLICDTCDDEFDLNPGENRENFKDECEECGGKLRYVYDFDLELDSFEDKSSLKQQITIKLKVDDLERLRKYADIKGGNPVSHYITEAVSEYLEKHYDES